MMTIMENSCSAVMWAKNAAFRVASTGQPKISTLPSFFALASTTRNSSVESMTQ